MRIDYDNEEVESFIRYTRAVKPPYTKYKSNSKLIKDLNKVMLILQTVENCSCLNRYRALNYEPLHYDMVGYSSIRIGYKSKYRLIFTELEDGIRINIIELSEHYGDK